MSNRPTRGRAGKESDRHSKCHRKRMVINDNGRTCTQLLLIYDEMGNSDIAADKYRV